MASGNKTPDVKATQGDMIVAVLFELLKEVKDEDAIQLIYKLLAIEPSERITIKDALKSEFITKKVLNNVTKYKIII